MNQSLLDEQLIDVRDLLRALNQYKWGIVSVAVVVTILATMFVFSITPTYQSTVTIMIEAQGNQPVAQVQDVYDPGYGRSEYYSTQFEILKSRDLARRVVERLDLTQRPEFARLQPSLAQQFDWRKWLPFLPESEQVNNPMTAQARDAEHKERVIDAFGDRLTVVPVLNTQLVKASFESEDPELAALVANTLAELFIENSLEGRLSMAQKASSWLTNKLSNLRDDLQKSEQALQAFREQEQLVNVGGERGLVEEELTDNAKRFREARKQTADLASAYWKIQQAGRDPARLEDVSPLLQNPVVQKAKESLLQASEAVKQLEPRYGPKHPDMVEARARLDAATAAYQTQLLTAAKGLQAEYEIARESERALGQMEASSRSTIRGLDRKKYQLGALERDVETNRQMHDLFMERFKETDLTGNYESVAARVVDTAVPPRVPFKPRKLKLIAISMIGGVMLGLLLAVFTALLSDIVRSSDELESLTGLPLLGVLPLVSGFGSAKSLAAQFTQHPKSGFSEGIRSIRTGVILSDPDKKRKRIIVTSCVPEEGKTTLAVNLAMAHGQIERVLLLEGDLRRPTIAKKCYLPKGSPGLTEVLSGNIKITDCIYRYEEGNIDIMPVGQVPPNSTEIITSERFHQLVDLLCSKYDRVIIDSAPCHAVSDTYLLARYADAMLFLVKADSTSRRMIRNAMQQLNHARVPLMGCVINQVDMKRHGHDFGSYYYDYGYYA